MPELVIDQRRRDLGGFEVGRVLPAVQRRMVGPFVFFDHMGPVDFPPASRARSTCGRIRTSACRPSPICSTARSCTATASARSSAIRPGEVNWMTAGRGITHSERFERAAPRGRAHARHPGLGRRCRRQTRRPSRPSPTTAPDDLPTYEADGLWARLIAGEAFGAKAKVKDPLADVLRPLAAGGRRQGAAAGASIPSAPPTSSQARSRSTASASTPARCWCSRPAQPVLFTGREPTPS